MFLSYGMIQSERQWKAVTGLSQQKFKQLSSWFGNTYEQVHGYDLIQPHRRSDFCCDRQGISIQDLQGLFILRFIQFENGFNF